MALSAPTPEGGGEAGISWSDRGQLCIIMQKPAVGANGAQLRITKLSVWVKA